MARTTVLIPNYNGIKFIEDCLRSVVASGDYPIIVVDNGSCDGSDELIEEQFPQVELIRLAENTGFCHAVNVGLEAINKGTADESNREPNQHTEFVFLLNNDTVIEPDAIEKLESCMDSGNDIFSAQSKILNLYNRDLIDDCGDTYSCLGWASARGKGKSSELYSSRANVFACCGAAVMYRMSLFDELGCFDERHFAYLEDIDLGYRARIQGYHNVFEPSSVIYHAGSATSGSRYNKFKVNLSSRNNIYLIYKNMPLLQVILNLPFLLVGFAVKTMFFILKGMGFTYVRGLFKGFGLCTEDIRDGHRHKVRFKTSNLKNYCKIQIELWCNLALYFSR